MNSTYSIGRRKDFFPQTSIGRPPPVVSPPPLPAHVPAPYSVQEDETAISLADELYATCEEPSTSFEREQQQIAEIEADAAAYHEAEFREHYWTQQLIHLNAQQERYDCTMGDTTIDSLIGETARHKLYLAHSPTDELINEIEKLGSMAIQQIIWLAEEAYQSTQSKSKSQQNFN